MFGMYPQTLEIMGISEPPNPTGSSQVFRATLASQVELVVDWWKLGRRAVDVWSCFTFKYAQNPAIRLIFFGL